jgi:hypothetical protein
MSESLIKPGNFVKVEVPLNNHTERDVIGLIFKKNGNGAVFYYFKSGEQFKVGVWTPTSNRPSHGIHIYNDEIDSTLKEELFNHAKMDKDPPERIQGGKRSKRRRTTRQRKSRRHRGRK